MMILYLLSIFLTCLLRYSLAANNYLLNQRCQSYSENTLIECDLIYDESNTKLKNGLKADFLVGTQYENKVFDASKLIRKLKFQARNLEGDVTHVKIFDSENTRYEIPRNAIEYFEKNKKFLPFDNSKLKDLQTLEQGKPFNFAYLNENGSEKLFSIFSENLLFMDDLIGFDYNLNTNKIFGYGERSSDFNLKPGVYTVWPRDMPNIYDDGKGARNSYGHQPFFINRNKGDSYIGFAFLNSNAQDLLVKYNQKNDPSEDKTAKLTQITIGGIIELLIIHATTPQQLLEKYHNIIGKPVLPNFWSLGWHQSRWGYRNTDHLRSVIENYNKHKIPIDTIWSDIDYMENYEDFGYDKDNNYKDLPQFVTDINSQGIHYVPIIDMGIPYRKNNYYYKLGKRLDIYIKSNYTKSDLLNNVWPGVCVFPDFTNYENAKNFWHHGLANLNFNLNFDGIWLDMNEPSGFFKGEVFEQEFSSKSSNSSIITRNLKTKNSNKINSPFVELEKSALTFDSDANKYANLSYMPGIFRENYDIDTSSLSVNAILSEEAAKAPFNSVFNLKPLNVFYENKITNEYFTTINKRPFILSRSSFIGMGRYSNHWLGDNLSFFNNMTRSIAGIFNSQMFGFNLVGADICGLMYDTTDELCARWTMLGAFYPFARNHNNYTSIDQEPYSLGNYFIFYKKIFSS